MTMTTTTLALMILGAIFVQITVVMLTGFYRRQRQYRNLGEGRGHHEARSGSRPPTPAAAKPSALTPAWEGFREFMVQRREIEDADRAICSFYLAPTDGAPLPAFRPGQFLTFRLQIEDPSTRVPKSVVRCYSLSDAPRPDLYRVTIKRVPAPADQPQLPPGISSGFFHDQLQEGDRLLVKAPSGHFHLLEDEALPMVLIGGGIGITPMLSILNSVLENAVQREVWLFYGVRNGAEQIMKNHLQSLAEAHANFHLHLCYSNPGAGDVAGVDYQHHGRVDLPLLRATLKLARYQFYVCGPGPMMETLVPGLEAWGVDRGDIHYESFGPATLASHKAPKAGAGESPGHSITVSFSRSHRQIPWDPAAGTLLEFAEAQGIEVESGCRAGSCGACQAVLESGEVDYSQQPDAEVAPRHCLLCITTPAGDITLAA